MFFCVIQACSAGGVAGAAVEGGEEAGAVWGEAGDPAEGGPRNITNSSSSSSSSPRYKTNEAATLSCNFYRYFSSISHQNQCCYYAEKLNYYLQMQIIIEYLLL